ncbi:pectate lyase [Pedobacter sp. B4-66]|uniref:pectate lyase family protein n=1 Tax=Pedobacter sp. B4-66 TaxID=2817280 RepID=UPI001BD97FBF|nr:pectate lyase [Pedobacter sp. B4-66]
MQVKRTSINKVILTTLFFTTIISFSSCEKNEAELVNPATNEIYDTNGIATLPSTKGTTAILSPTSFKSDGGFSYKLREEISNGDSNSAPTQSILRLYENGVEIGPAHSIHDDIRNVGKGRFSHWGSTVIFSASDNSDPRTNGRKYTYTMGDPVPVPPSSAIAINVSTGKIDAKYSFRVAMDPRLISDSSNQPKASTVRVYENGVEIGPAHSVHDQIRNIGGGRFSHWAGFLYFSTSDNSNPQTNGRKYTYTVGAQGTTPPTIAPPTTTPPSGTDQGVSSTKPIGYAAVNGMTTGGAGGQTVTVTSLSQLKSAAGSSSPMIIKVSGTITGTGSVAVRSNKSIIGLTGATLNGVGLRLHGTSTSDYVKNIIIQNLKIKNVIAVDPVTGGGDNDAIGLKWADHVWVDHCELSADLSHSDWEYYDGLLDISKQSDYVTVSWTKFSNSFKGTGVGGSSDAGQGRLRITYHHNLFENIGERAPSFGYGTGHLFNNYFLKSATSSGYSVASRSGAVVLVENNYFESINNPIRTDLESPGGYVGGLATNIFKSSGAAKVTTSASSFVPTYEYKSGLTAAASVPSVVLAGAGQK